MDEDVLNRLEKSGVIYKLIYKRCKVTYMGQTGSLLNTRVEEQKNNLGRKCNYHNVLFDHRKEYADHDFDWNNVEFSCWRSIEYYLCKWWWVVEIKNDERKKKKEGVLEGCLLFSFLLFCLFSQCFFYF